MMYCTGIFHYIVRNTIKVVSPGTAAILSSRAPPPLSADGVCPPPPPILAHLYTAHWVLGLTRYVMEYFSCCRRWPHELAKDTSNKPQRYEDFHSQFLTLFLHLSITNRYNAVQSTSLKIFFKFVQIFEIFYHSPISPKARSITELCRRKRGVKFSVVFVTVRFQIVLSVFGEKGESNFAFSAKARS